MSTRVRSSQPRAPEPSRTDAWSIVDPSRLGPPAADYEIVARHRLVALRPPADDAHVVLVVAPAGYGKTTLVSEWATRATTPVIWLSLDQHLNDPTSLVAHLAEATMRVTGPDPSLEASVRAPSANAWTSSVPRLGMALQRSSPHLMVLDDVHAITSPASRDVIDWLALHVPAGGQLVISGRSLEGMRLARLRVSGDAASLGQADLALTDADALELMRRAGLDISMTRAREVNRECEGWVSGVLMTVASRSGRPVTQKPAARVVSDELVLAYVDSEILAPLSADQREFMTRASLLRMLTPSLCDSALERTDSAQQLEELHRSSAFVSRLPDGSSRLHDLVRLTMRGRIERAQPGISAAIMRRAAMWHAERGDTHEAVEYAQRSGDRELACRLIGSYAVVLLGHGRTETLKSWFDWVEANDLISTDAASSSSGAIVSALTGDPQRCERWTAAVLDMATRSEGSVKAQWLPYALHLDAWLCRRGDATMLESATRSCELLGPDSPLYGSAIGALGIAQLMCGQDQAAMRTMQRIVDELVLNPDQNAVTVAQVYLARHALAEGDLDAAWDLLQQAGARRRELSMTENGLHALHDAVSARVMLAMGGSPDDVRPLLVHAQTVRPQSSWAIPGLAMPIRLELVKAYLALNDVAGARAVLREAYDILKRRPGLGAMEAEANRLQDLLRTQSETVTGPSALTSAELRLVPWLATHLSFREIGERLYLSTNTVKTEALSTYRKLGVSSRSAAVEAAVNAGLLDPASLPGILHAASWRDVDRGDPDVAREDSPVRDDGDP
jgi:LuxR family maltose regulon positive regulatory protein